jgi:hypothetical protein
MSAESEGSENKPAEQRMYIITVIAKYARKTEHLISECEQSSPIKCHHSAHKLIGTVNYKEALRISQIQMPTSLFGVSSPIHVIKANILKTHFRTVLPYLVWSSKMALARFLNMFTVYPELYVLNLEDLTNPTTKI